jgi:hypothetical protein
MYPAVLTKMKLPLRRTLVQKVTLCSKEGHKEHNESQRSPGRLGVLCVTLGALCVPAFIRLSVPMVYE